LGIWGTTWVTGDVLYISKVDPGVLTNVEPTVPNHSDIVGIVDIIGDIGVGSILVRIDRHKDFVGLSDINGTPLTTSGQIPVWDQISQVFDFTVNINDKQAVLISGSNIKTVGGMSILGAGDVPVTPTVWRGPYNNGTSYILNDEVSFQGSSYICILASTGNNPTNGTYWNLVAQKGDPGVAGVSGAMTTPFTSQTSETIPLVDVLNISCKLVTHNFNAYPAVQVIDAAGLVMLPLTITHSSPNAFVVTFSELTSGNIVCTIGGVNTSVASKTADYTVTATDNMIICNGSITITLISPTALAGKDYTIINESTTGSRVKVIGIGGELISGQSFQLVPGGYSAMTVRTDGTSWFII